MYGFITIRHLRLLQLIPNSDDSHGFELALNALAWVSSAQVVAVLYMRLNPLQNFDGTAFGVLLLFAGYLISLAVS